MDVGRRCWVSCLSHFNFQSFTLPRNFRCVPMIKTELNGKRSRREGERDRDEWSRRKIWEPHPLGAVVGWQIDNRFFIFTHLVSSCGCRDKQKRRFSAATGIIVDQIALLSLPPSLSLSLGSFGTLSNIRMVVLVYCHWLWQSGSHTHAHNIRACTGIVHLYWLVHIKYF